MSAKHPAVVPAARSGTRVRLAPPESPDVFELAERGLRATIGIGSIAAETVAAALARTYRGGEESLRPSGQDEPLPRRTLPTLVGAGLVITLEAGRAGVRLASTVGRSVVPWTSFATSFEAVRGALARGGDALAALDDRWRSEQATDRTIAAEVVGSIARQAVEAIDALRPPRAPRSAAGPARSRAGR
jgi:hypothetical protein